MTDPLAPCPAVSRRSLLQAAGGLAAVAGAGTLGACSKTPAPAGGQPSNGGTPSTVTFYGANGATYKTWEKVMQQFESDHGITVNFQRFSKSDLVVKLQADFAAGTVPDLVMAGGSSVVIQFINAGQALDLAPYIDKDGEAFGYPNDWQDQAATSWVFDGKTYGIQLFLTCLQIYYNTAMLSDAGISAPPDKWDDFLSAAKELTRGDVYGCALNQDSFYSQPWLLQNGVTYFDEDSSTVVPPHDAAVAAMQFQYDLIHKHKVSPVPVSSKDPEGPRQLFSAKRAAMLITGPWDITTIQSGSPGIDFNLSLPLEMVKRSTPISGSGVFIPAMAKSPDLAWDLLMRLGSKETMLEVTKEVGLTMPRKSWAREDVVTSDPKLNAVAEALQYGADWSHSLAATGKLAKIDQAYDEAYQAMMIQGAEPADRMKQFWESAQSMIS